MNERDFPFNAELLEFFNGLMQYNTGQMFVNIFVDIPAFFMPVFLFVWWLFYTFKQKNIAKKIELLNIFYTAVIGIFANIILQQFFHFERPEELCKTTGNLILQHLPDASFPSDHAAMSFAFMVAVYLAGYKKTAFALSFVFTCMIISRVMACVHWPYDVLVGAIFGSLISLFTFKFLQKNSFVQAFNEKIIWIAGKMKL
ncbi:phosphatase PAP2 family protein [Candidatus Gracilibacteria bacterium]|nr:phosphatase PAP2 family protein [Candidatus Gracilibacteria bacterium]